jgi:hypothetical protein
LSEANADKTLTDDEEELSDTDDDTDSDSSDVDSDFESDLDSELGSDSGEETLDRHHSDNIFEAFGFIDDET